MMQEAKAAAEAADAAAQGAASAAEGAAHATAAVEGAAHAAEGGHSLNEQISHNIMHHISNGNTLEIPFVGEVHLPVIHLFGLDLSITRHVVMMWVVAALLLLLFGLAFRRRSLVPTGLAGALEIPVLFIRDEVAIRTLGEKDGRRLTPYLLTVFFFILACNLLGLVPYAATATGNINVTGALALCTLLMIQFEGIRRNGVVKHFGHMIPKGIPVYMFPLAILIFLIELLGFLIIKPFALMVRLFANMTAGHVAILALISIIFALQMAAAAAFAIPFALFVYCLELLVALIQAYIFTILTSLFISLTLHPAH